jgi:hypothetical protein
MNQRHIFLSRNHVEDELKNLLFSQLLGWFLTRSSDLKKFKKISLVGPRRNKMESFLCSKEKDDSKKVLKCFGNLSLSQNMELIVYELLVPLIVDHPLILQNKSVFVNDKVRKILSIM